MRSNAPSYATAALLAVAVLTQCFLLPVSGFAHSTECDTWLESVGDYDLALDAIMERREARGLLRDLALAIQSSETGDADPLIELETLMATRVAAFQQVKPPKDLKVLHGRLLAYHESIAVTSRGIREDDGPKAANAYLRFSVAGLLDYYEELHSVLVAHNCAGGDAEALAEQYIPQLRALLTALQEQNR
jgi:hypothetical protein